MASPSGKERPVAASLTRYPSLLVLAVTMLAGCSVGSYAPVVASSALGLDHDSVGQDPLYAGLRIFWDDGLFESMPDAGDR